MGKITLLLLFLSTGSLVIGKDGGLPSNPVREEGEDGNEEASGDNGLQKRDGTKMNNIGYLFKGYNIIKGNPLSPEKTFDPGFQQMIFEATYEGNKKTADGRFEIPDNVEVTKKLSCRTEFSSETVMTMSDYQNSLMAKASVEGSAKIKVVDAAFSASIEYNRVRKTVESNTKSIIKSEASCTVYNGMVNTGAAPKFTQNFLAFVDRLKQKQTRDYGRFIDTFGTHYIASLDMGARYTKLQEISKENQEKMQKDGIDVKRAASLSAAGIASAKNEQQVKYDTEIKNTFNKAVEKTVVVSIGSKPPADGQDSTWLQTTIDEPLPLYYSLRSIVELFDPEYFPGDDTIKTVRKRLRRYLQRYCKNLKKNYYPDVQCEGPPKGCKGGSQCSINADCIDGGSNYQCKCKPGYKGSGQICNPEPKWKMTSKITHENTRGTYGTWGGMEYCENGILARGYTFRVEKDLTGGDDTGGNAVCLKCGHEDVCSKQATWGDWQELQLCPKHSYLTGWKQNVESGLDYGDDTSLDNVEYRCRDVESWEITKDLNVWARTWGKWSRWKECPEGEFICGINTRVEDPDGDDTALNDIEHQCCKPIYVKKKKKAEMLQYDE